MMGNGGLMKLLEAIPWIACSDVSQTLTFFEEKLGFSREWTWGEPPTDAGVRRDEARLYLFHNPDLAARIRDSEITLVVEKVDELYAEHQSREAPIEMPITNEPWGSREYHVREINGYKLRFSGEPEAAK
jgi:uncharacterized glyoxalase superfamily protein PhnB